MVRVVLFDLDGTLLPLDVDAFLEKYTRAICAKVAHITEPRAFVKQLLYATEKMLKDKTPELTNQEVFWEHFLSGINAPHNQLIPLMDEFYEKDFPDLGQDIQCDGEASALVARLKSRGIKMVLATNAVFPEAAVIERMRWVSVDPEDFEFITTYENMHFCKPHLEYYQEIIERLGERPENCIMVGNDVEEDMIAGKIGIKTFLYGDFLIHRGSNLPYDYSGKLSDLEKVLGLI